MVVVSEGEKSSVIFTVVELLLIGLLLLCNCLNLVSVLGFSSSASARPLEPPTDTHADSWQSALLGIQPFDVDFSHAT